MVEDVKILAYMKKSLLPYLEMSSNSDAQLIMGPACILLPPAPESPSYLSASTWPQVPSCQSELHLLTTSLDF